jgi:hypothetical protein
MGLGSFLSGIKDKAKSFGNKAKEAGTKAWNATKTAGKAAGTWVNDHKYELTGTALQGLAMYHGLDASAALGMLSKASKGTAAHDAIKRMKRGSRFQIAHKTPKTDEEKANGVKTNPETVAPPPHTPAPLPMDDIRPPTQSAPGVGKKVMPVVSRWHK